MFRKRFSSIIECHFSHIIRQNFSTASRPQITNIQLLQSGKYSAIELKSNQTTCGIKIPLVWFRDHCRSSKLYNWASNQRLSDANDLFEKSQLIENNPIEFDQKSQTLNIKWLDGHNSIFTSSEIFDWSIVSQANVECTSRTLWDKTVLKEIPTLSSRNFDFGVFSRLFVRFGVVSVIGVDFHNEQKTRKLCESIAPLHNTMFGDFWVFGNTELTSDVNEDTAYGSDGIGPHNDGTYFDSTPGIQVFHCLKPADQGGETLLVDGFSAAEKLRKEFPKAFSLLSSVPIEHHFLQGLSSNEEENVQSKTKIYAKSVAYPVINLFNNKLTQIRYNPYDRAPMRFINSNSETYDDFANLIDFYDAYETLAKIIKRDEQCIRINLQPGTVIFIDNYRVLHGRTTFKGARKMCGCYMSRDGLLAKARPYLSSSLYKNA